MLAALLSLIAAVPLLAQPKAQAPASSATRPVQGLGLTSAVIAPLDEAVRTAIAAPAASDSAASLGSCAPSAPSAPSAATERVDTLGAALTAELEAAERALDASPAEAGRRIERALTGESSLAAGAAEPAGRADAAHAAQAAAALAARADDLGAERGLKASRMTGGQFIALLEDARAELDARDAQAGAAASAVVRAQVVRIARAMIPAGEPLQGTIRRALAVWQVFDQELAAAAERGGVDAVVSEARVFADQVEASIEPRPAPTPALAPASPRPEDPDGYHAVNVPGSVFGWQPIERSPSHGLPWLDRLIRKALADGRAPYQAGFEFRGAAWRADARIFLYGERHTNGALIAENMRQLVRDARRGERALILVETYTGWPLVGPEARKYLEARGTDVDALAANGVVLEVRGWDHIDGSNRARSALMSHHMRMLELNHLAHSEETGLRYYAKLARGAWHALRSWRSLWKIAIVSRNRDLDNNVRIAAAELDGHGGTVHVIAGADHLIESPLRLRLGLARPALRASLRGAIGGRPFWASMPSN